MHSKTDQASDLQTYINVHHVTAFYDLYNLIFILQNSSNIFLIRGRSEFFNYKIIVDISTLKKERNYEGRNKVLGPRLRIQNNFRGLKMKFLNGLS
jgi:hypothetical protein